MTRNNFVVHNLSQGILLAEIATKNNKPITIFSSPGAGSSLGAETFLEMISLIKSQCPAIHMLAILDCGSEAGMALSAMRRGVKNIHCKTSGEVDRKLKQIAHKNYVTLHSIPKNTIDLNLVLNTQEAIQFYFRNGITHE